MVENFDEHWPAVAGQFPLYVLFLHSLQLATEFDAQTVVTAAAVAVFGIFGTTLFYLGRSLLKLGIASSVFLAVFVVFQMAVLRTAWDLHRDVFALTAMMFVLVLFTRKSSWKGIAIVLALAALTVAADRMIGALLCITLVAYAIMTRRKAAITTSLFATGLFSILLIASHSGTAVSEGGVGAPSLTTPAFYYPLNLLILFAVANGLLVIPAAIGFMRIKNYLLRIPLLVSIVGSFSWLALQDVEQLVADRWIILAGVFLAIFAGYGILRITRNLKPRFSVAVGGFVLASFVAIGLAYAVMPYDSPFELYGMARNNIEDFGPVTMQFNSLDVKDNDKLISAIGWINQNTEPNAIIVGEKHWRGFMELYLQDERTYRFSSNPDALSQALERQGKPTYQLLFDGSSPGLFQVEDVAIR